MSKYSKELIRSTEYCLKQYERDYKLMDGSYYGSMKLRILYNILNCKNDKTYEKRCDSLVKQLELEKDFV